MPGCYRMKILNVPAAALSCVLCDELKLHTGIQDPDLFTCHKLFVSGLMAQGLPHVFHFICLSVSVFMNMLMSATFFLIQYGNVNPDDEGP